MPSISFGVSIRRFHPDSVLVVKDTRLFDGQLYRIDNWYQLHQAITVLQQNGWQDFVNMDDWMRQFIERHDSSDPYPEVDSDMYEGLARRVPSLVPEISLLLSALEPLAKRPHPKAFCVDIGEVDSYDDLQTSILELNRMFEILSIEEGFSYGGVESGSVWLSWIPDGDVVWEWASHAIRIAGQVFDLFRTKSDDEVRGELRAALLALKSDEGLTEELVKSYTESLVEEKTKALWEEVQPQLLPLLKTQNQHEAENRLIQGVHQIREQQQKGRYPQLSVELPPSLVRDGGEITVTVAIRPGENKEKGQLPAGTH